MKRLFTPLAVGAAAWLLVACGGGDSPGARPDRPRHGAARRRQRLPRRRPRRASPPAGSTPRLRRRAGPGPVWVSLEQNSVAAQRAALAEAAGMTDRRPHGHQVGVPLRAGVAEHRLRVRDSQGRWPAASSRSAARNWRACRTRTTRSPCASTPRSSRRSPPSTGVAKVRPVLNYELDLSETVPYVGAAAVQAQRRRRHRRDASPCSTRASTTRTATSVAPARPTAYAAAYGTATADPKNTTRDGLFPTAKVVGGYDFVGEAWPNGAARPPRPGPDRLRRPRHARGRHHRRQEPGRHAQGHGARAPSWWRSRCAAPSPRPAAASRCCRAWTSRSTRTATATPATRST